ncbi:peptide ABC transporter ATP-binding protein [Kaistia sp. 32K]|uniref:dipeptide ABC transporter ATP-binding protein n=1 Tax=Kaistia sp. 32K TaxID=2795690 RepID=UPI0019164782|nr:ABC transporter ATP-binding protein [Kaistia sp. 32K]BCP52171.1 peptide ABC transporter ATP-binding protein [Kaistia sp. 32K]
MTASPQPVAQLKNLSVDYFGGDSWTRAVDDVSLEIASGEALGLAGESGSGKTTVAYCLMGEKRGASRIGGGQVLFRGRDVFELPQPELLALRGRSIGFVPQNPMASLTPSMRVGRQIGEMLTYHSVAAPQGVSARVVELLEQVGIPQPAEAARRYPHELSGGQQQRVAIAIALACRPDLIILDEPTTGLDVTTQKRILELLATLKRETGVSMLYVSHDLASLSQICERVAVMQRGKLVEEADATALFERPAHDYTRRLIAAIPRIDVPPPNRPAAPPAETGSTKPLLEVENLSICYANRRLLGLGKYPPGSDTVKGVSFSVARGRTFALIGESGSGKSSIARAVAGLSRPRLGTIRFGGAPVAALAQRRPVLQRQKIQIIFQNPDSSLNPRKTVRSILARPLRMFGTLDAKAREARVAELLEAVRLDPAYANRRPHQLSGGERQRVAIARALAADPDLIICDEILSALDVSVQASILELLETLQRERGLTYLFISHDLAVVRWFAQEIGVLNGGAFCEIGDTETTLRAPSSPYTAQLLNAVPRIGADLSATTPPPQRRP